MSEGPNPEFPTQKVPNETILKNLPEGTQVVAPMEGTIHFEYNKEDKLEDGSLRKGKVVIISKTKEGHIVRMTIEADDLKLSNDAPTITSEEGVVKSSQPLPIKAGEPLFVIKNKGDVTLRGPQVSKP